MAYVNHRLSAVIVTNPAAAKREIIAAFKKAKAHLANAAEELGVNTSTLERWIAKLDLRDEIDRLRESARKAGWWHGQVGGRPPAKKSSAKKKRAA